NRRQRQLPCQLFQLFLIPVNKRGPFEKVLRKIAADAKLGKNGKVRSPFLGACRQFQDASRIPRKIADGGIKLRQRNLHSRYLEYVPRPTFANSPECKCLLFSSPARNAIPARAFRGK